MHAKISIFGRRSSSASDRIPTDCGDMICNLEAMPPGRQFQMRDGCRFIRTNLICFGFCNLATGQLCSARDVCSRHGGATLNPTGVSVGPESMSDMDLSD